MVVEPVPNMAEAFSTLPGSDACRHIVAIHEPYGVRRIALFGSQPRRPSPGLGPRPAGPVRDGADVGHSIIDPPRSPPKDLGVVSDDRAQDAIHSIPTGAMPGVINNKHLRIDVLEPPGAPEQSGRCVLKRGQRLLNSQTTSAKSIRPVPL